MCHSTRKIPGGDLKYMLNMTHAWLLVIILLPWVSPVTAGGERTFTLHSTLRAHVIKRMPWASRMHYHRWL